MYDEEANSLGGYDDSHPHRLMNPVCIFGHRINKEQVKGGHEYWKYKKDSISNLKQSYAFR